MPQQTETVPNYCWATTVVMSSIIIVALSDTSIRRWQRYSGKVARLDGSTASFEEIADRRNSSPARHDVGGTKHENGR